MLKPNLKHYQKMHLFGLNGIVSKKISFYTKGSILLQSSKSAYIKYNQIEAARKTISREIKKEGKLFLHIFPNQAITVRSKDSRMGSGKGPVEYWVTVVYPGTTIFEIYGVNKELAIDALKKASYKLSIPITIITKKEL